MSDVQEEYKKYKALGKDYFSHMISALQEFEKQDIPDIETCVEMFNQNTQIREAKKKQQEGIIKIIQGLGGDTSTLQQICNDDTATGDDFNQEMDRILFNSGSNAKLIVSFSEKRKVAKRRCYTECFTQASLHRR